MKKKGQWLENRKDGKGVYLMADGSKYDGLF